MSEKKLSNISSISAIVASTLGCGITLMPYVFSILGTRIAFSMMICIGIMTYHSIYSLSYVAAIIKTEKDQKFTYSQLAAKFSKKLEKMVSFCLAISSLITVFMFTQTFLKIVIGSLSYNEKLKVLLANKAIYFGTRAAILLAISTVYYFLFQKENLASLSIFSTLSLWVAIFFCLFISFLGLYKPALSTELPKTDNFELTRPLGYIIFALHCQFSYMDIYNSMENTSISNTRFVAFSASVLATILYSTVGYLGSKAAGSFINADPIIFKFAFIKPSTLLQVSPEIPTLIDSLVQRYGIVIGAYIPRLIHTLFCPIFFNGIVFSMFAIIPILQKAFSRKEKPLSRRKTSFIAVLFIFLTGLPSASDFLDTIFAISGFLLTTPLSFLFPALFELYASENRLGLLTMSSKLMISLSFLIMISLTAMKIKSSL